MKEAFILCYEYPWAAIGLGIFILAFLDKAITYMTIQERIIDKKIKKICEERISKS